MAKQTDITDADVPRETIELSAIERRKISDALDIFAGVIARRANAEKNEAIKAILLEDKAFITRLCGRFS